MYIFIYKHYILMNIPFSKTSKLVLHNFEQIFLGTSQLTTILNFLESLLNMEKQRNTSLKELISIISR